MIDTSVYFSDCVEIINDRVKFISFACRQTPFAFNDRCEDNITIQETFQEQMRDLLLSRSIKTPLRETRKHVL